MDLHKAISFVSVYYPVLFLLRYLYSLNAFFQAAKKYDEDFYSQLGRPHLFLNSSWEIVDLFFRCMWFKRYFGRDERIVCKAKALRRAFFVLLLVVVTYPPVRTYMAWQF